MSKIARGPRERANRRNQKKKAGSLSFFDSPLSSLFFALSLPLFHEKRKNTPRNLSSRRERGNCERKRVRTRAAKEQQRSSPPPTTFSFLNGPFGVLPLEGGATMSCFAFSLCLLLCMAGRLRECPPRPQLRRLSDGEKDEGGETEAFALEMEKFFFF